MAQISIQILSTDSIAINITELDAVNYTNKPREVDLEILDQDSGSTISYSNIITIPNGVADYYKIIDYSLFEGVHYQITAIIYYYTAPESEGGGVRTKAISNSVEFYQEPTTPLWMTVAHHEVITKSTEFENFQIYSNTLHRFTIRCPYGGKAKFQAVFADANNVSTIMYLSDTRYFDNTLGVPEDILISGSAPLEYDIVADEEYYFWVRARDAEHSGNKWIIIELPTQSGDEDSRPDRFVWTYAKVKGQPFNLTADEWNSLTTNINKVRAYKQLSRYSFTIAEQNKPLTATMYNQVKSAIQGISGAGAGINEAFKGNPVTADCLNILVESINKVE